MKLKRLISAGALAFLAVLPIAGSARERHRDDDRNRQDYDRRDDRWDRDMDPWSRNGRQDRNDRWAQNGGHDNGKHSGWYKNAKAGRWDDWASYEARHDAWHRSQRTTHRDDCRYDDGRWRYEDCRYCNMRNDRYDRNDDRYGRSDPYYDNGRYDRNGGYGGYEYDRREQTKREWRSLGAAAGLLGILGTLNHDDTLAFAGTAGALYSEYRYREDQKSQDRIARGRAYYFGQPDFYRDGYRYERRTVDRNGQRYYQFIRCDD